MSRSPFVSLLVSVAALVPSTYAAADDAAQTELTQALGRFDQLIGEAQKNGADAYGSFEDPSTCLAAVEKLQQLGARPTTVIEGRKSFLLKQAPEMCKEYAGWKHLIDGGHVLRNGNETLQIVNGFEPGKVGKEWIERAARDGKACADGVDQALAAGARTDTKVQIGWSTKGTLIELTLAEGKEQVCKPLLTWGKGYAEASTKAKAADEAALRKKYAGIKADRLRLFMEYDDVYWRGRGCEVVDDVKALAKAPVLFHRLQNSDGTYTIRRYQFKGDKLVKTTNKTFLTEAAAIRGCK